MQKKRYRIGLFTAAFAALLLCVCVFAQNYYHLPKNRSSDVSELQEDMVLLGGMPVGLYMQTNGVMVIHPGTIEMSDGSFSSPAEFKVKAGDYITAINQHTVDNKKELLDELEKIETKDVTLTIRRHHENLDIQTETVQSKDGKTMLGLWVRDDVQGLGTITYVKGDSFVALGHGIHDTDTNELLEIKGGTLYRTSIRSISKSTEGVPGSMEGIIVYSVHNELGTIRKNQKTGIYGSLKSPSEVLDEVIPIQIAKKEEITLGNATVRCKVSDEIKEYKIKIKHLDYSDHEINKGMTIEITDPELLSITGGIVQGMSGSPIIQNGKLIGAITHVFIQDSKKGYGIFIENMSQ